LKTYEEEVLENHRLLSLDIALKATHARWWVVHNETTQDWYQCKRLLALDLAHSRGEIKCNGMVDRENQWNTWKTRRKNKG
jgi:hypothetical protein